VEVHQVAAYCGLKNGRPSLSELWGTARVSKPRFVSSFLMILAPWVDAIPAFFVVDERGKIICGDVSLDASVEFVLAQRLGLIDEAAAGA